jgi:hypothetical protein
MLKKLSRVSLLKVSGDGHRMGRPVEGQAWIRILLRWPGTATVQLPGTVTV